MSDRVMAAIRWLSMAPPFAGGSYTESDTLLYDRCYFEKGDTWYADALGKTVMQAAPAVMARNTSLPEVPANEKAPFVIGFQNPNGAYAIATVRRYQYFTDTDILYWEQLDLKVPMKTIWNQKKIGVSFPPLDPAKLKHCLEARIGADVAAGRVGGAVVAVRQNGQLLYEGCFGTTVPNGNQPLQKDALFRIASMTKPITAVATLILMEQGKLSLSDPVSRYLPEYTSLSRVCLQNGKLTDCGRIQTPPTLLHLLTHTSGIGGGTVGSSQLAAMTRAQKADLNASVAYYAQAGLQFDPGSEVLYSGVPAFDVLAAIIQQVTGQPYERFLRENIFIPCRMSDTTFTPSPAQLDRMITMHDYVDGKSCIGQTYDGCIFEDFPTSHALGGAGLVSTLDDYCHFAEMLLQNGSFEGNRVLSPASISLLSQPHVSKNLQPKTRRWGLAVKVVTDPEDATLPLEAYGWSGAYGTHFWIDPINRITAVYMKNSHYDGGGGAITNTHFEEDVYSALA